MNIIVFTSTVGKSAFGLTSHKLLGGLAQRANLSLVLAENYKNSISGLSEESVLSLKRRYMIHIVISKLFMIFFAVDIMNLYWMFSNKKKIESFCRDKKPDILYAYCSLGDSFIANAVRLTAERLRIKYAIHFCDPIPSPKACETYERYRVNRIKAVRKTFQNASMLSFNNSDIIRHTQGYLSFDIASKSIIIPDTCDDSLKNIPICSDCFIFSYIGQFYTINRTPDNLIKAFDTVLKKYPNIYLTIIGSNRIDKSNYDIDPKTEKHILIYDWVDNIDLFLEQSSVLLDITMDIDSDLFISSKLKKYLTINRQVLSIARENSSTRKFLSKMDGTVVKCNHDVESIIEGMEECICRFHPDMDFSERKSLISECSVDTVSEHLISHFERILH